MKPPLKIRLWNPLNKQMQRVPLAERQGALKINQSQLMLALGIQDKNGTDIFEGDLVKVDYSTKSNSGVWDVFQVKYNPNSCTFALADPHGFCLDHTSWRLTGLRPDFYEVVGNVCATPDWKHLQHYPQPT